MPTLPARLQGLRTRTTKPSPGMSLPLFAYTVTDSSGLQPHVADQQGTELESRKIIVEATPQNQQRYNRVKGKFNKDRLPEYVTSSTQSSRLHPPQTPGTLSVSDDSGLTHSPTRSVCSDGAGSSAYTSAQRTDASQSSTTPDNQKLRGKRKNPLKPNARFHAAVVRAFKLVCEEHRIKKTKVSTEALKCTSLLLRQIL